MKDDANRSRLSAALRMLRRQKGWTLAEVSERTGFSVPTLSKVENDRLSLSYDKLIRLSEGLGVNISQLFAPVDAAGMAPAAIIGRRSLTKRGEGQLVSTRNYDYYYLSTDVVQKKFIPILAEVRARSLEEFGGLVRHTGEEFIYVVEGVVEVHTDLYAPMVLNVGDSAYIDSAMGHAYVNAGEGPCRLLAVCSASEQEVRDAIEKKRAAEPAPKASRAKKKAPKRHR
jgi:transcriptional regulator with XRE-family HTH domain